MEILKALGETEQLYLQQLLSDPIKRLKEHSDIGLTEAEIAEALTKAKSEKSLRLQYEKSEQLRRQHSDEIMKPFTPEQLIAYCQKFYFMRFRQHFIIDQYNKGLIEKLALYFTGDTEFNKPGYSLDRGILIMGNVGRGKTELMKFFQKNKKRCYTVIPCSTVADEYLVYKDEIEKVYSSGIEKPLHDPSVFFQKHIGYCFDDLGTEENKNAFGNKKNVLADIIMAIYNKKDFEKFHITTNLDIDEKEFEQRYGTRVVSRFKEMFNVFILDGTDRRDATPTI